MAYIGTQPKDIRSFGKAKFDFTATQGQTAFTGADDDGKTLGFTDGQISVYVNGILMDESDYTTSGSNTVTLTSAANLNDIISVVALQTDIPNSDYVPATGGTFSGALDVNEDGATVLTVDRATSDGTIIDVQKNGTSVGCIGTIGGDTLTVGSGDTGLLMNQTLDEIIPWNVSSNAARDNAVDLGDASHRFKDLYLSGGVYLGGTGSANKLDDYEEGTYNPTSPHISFSNSDGTYTKVGRLCHLSFRIVFPTGLTSGTTVRINLPFTSVTHGGIAASGHLDAMSLAYTTYSSTSNLQGGAFSGASYFELFSGSSAVSYANMSGKQINGSITFQTN